MLYHKIMRFGFSLLLLAGCAGTWTPRPVFEYHIVSTNEYDIATYRHITDNKSPIHIYIEGDGHAFNAYGEPTSDPTPRGRMMRNLAMRDDAPNVVYMARPCQFIMSPACETTDWSDGRFSARIVDAMANAIKITAKEQPVILVGYSGGGLLSGIIINRHPEIRVKGWITIAGVPNHSAWTKHFGDTPLTKSLDLNKLPNVPATHYIGARDRVVPPTLARKFFPTSQIVEISNADHDDFENININFD